MIKIHLSKLLGDRKLKQSDLARETGIRPTTINKICRALDCSIADLVEYIPDNPASEEYLKAQHKEEYKQ